MKLLKTILFLLSVSISLFFLVYFTVANTTRAASKNLSAVITSQLKRELVLGDFRSAIINVQAAKKKVTSNLF